MDILLIEPPPVNRFGNMRQFGSIGSYKARIAYPPIDLMKIAGYLRKFGVESMIYDANSLRATLADVTRLMERESPRLVVFTTSTTAIRNDIRVAEQAKALSGDILTATFGAHVKGTPLSTLRENECLDIAIYGDPEAVVRELVEKNYNPTEVRGICFRRGKEIIQNKPHPPVHNLDEYGIAAYDLVDPTLYHDPFSKRSPLTITYGQIGCVNQCSYCMSTLYGRLRTRTVPHFIEELKFIERVGFKEVFFIDCGFTNNLTWAGNLTDAMIRESLDLSWWCLSRADHLNQEILAKMKAAGCHSIGVGVESANRDIIRNIHKKVDPEQVKKIVGTAHRLKMKILLYFQFGLPGETRETMQETLDYALQSGADLVTFGIATPVPGTRFYDYIQENGFFNTEDWSLFDPTLKPVYDYPHLSSDEIFAFSKKAYKAFYMRPDYILKRFVHQRSLQDIRNNFGNFINLVSRLFAA